MGRCSKCAFMAVSVRGGAAIYRHLWIHNVINDSYGSCRLLEAALQSWSFNDIKMQLMQQNEIYANVIDPSVQGPFLGRDPGRLGKIYPSPAAQVESRLEDIRIPFCVVKHYNDCHVAFELGQHSVSLCASRAWLWYLTIPPSFSYGSNLVQLVFFPQDGEHELCWIMFGLLFQRTNPSLSMRSKDNNWTVAVTGMKDANNCVRVTSIEDLGANLATPDTSTCLSATNMCLVNLWISNLIFFSLLDVVDKWIARLWMAMMHKTPSLNTQLWVPQFTSLTSHVSAKLCEVRRQLQLRSSKGFKTSHFQWLHLWQ